MDDTTAAQPPDPSNSHQADDADIVQSPGNEPAVPTPGFSRLAAPDPVVASPPESARAMAFVAILVGGLLGGLVGYGIGDLLYSSSTWSAAGALAGALTGAVGLGVLANLTLRAMNEWRTASHPESGAVGKAGLAGKSSNPKPGT